MRMQYGYFWWSIELKFGYAVGDFVVAVCGKSAFFGKIVLR